MSKTKTMIIENRNYYLPLDFPVVLIAGNNWRISDVPSKRLHFHNCLEIGICHSDSGILKFSGEEIPFKEGDLTFIPRNIPHTTFSARGTKSLWSYLFLDPELLFKNMIPLSWKNRDLSIRDFRGFRHILGRKEYPFLHQLALQVIKELKEKEEGFQISVRSYLLALYIELYRIQNQADALLLARAKGPENSLVISPALSFIEDNYMQEITMADLADLCRLSLSHFRRSFKNITGVSPLEYLNITRIMKACNLLQSTPMSVLQIAEETGFHSISCFNRYFGKVIGSSPKSYRKRMHKPAILQYTGWYQPENLSDR